MFTGNNLYKQDPNLNKVRITTDDIPEGVYNKYCLNYADGKNVGDIVVRFSPEEIACHSWLNGQKRFAYQVPDLYAYCIKNKQRAASGDDNYAFYNKTEADYTSFFNTNIWSDTEQHYCPFFVTSTESIRVYKIRKDDYVYFTPLVGEQQAELLEGPVYKDSNLTIIYDTDPQGWLYTGEYVTTNMGYIHLPIIPTYTNGNVKSFYFVVNKSRVDDSTTSIRQVRLGEVTTLGPSDEAYVRNSGTIQNLILDFGIPKGLTPHFEIGRVEDGVAPDVTITGTEAQPILNFVMPKGEKGDAGGVLALDFMSDTQPAKISSNKNKKWYDTVSNKIYKYTGADWVFLENPDAGMIYLYENTVYFYNGSTITKTYASLPADELTLSTANDTISVIGVKAATGENLYDWIGTLQDYEIALSNGTITSNHICYITDDGNTKLVADYYDKSEIDARFAIVNQQLGQISQAIIEINEKLDQIING